MLTGICINEMCIRDSYSTLDCNLQQYDYKYYPILLVRQIYRKPCVCNSMYLSDVSCKLLQLLCNLEFSKLMIVFNTVSE